MAKLNPINMLEHLFWKATFENTEHRTLICTILWNAMYHLDYEYSDHPRIPSFYQPWAVHRSNISI